MWATYVYIQRYGDNVAYGRYEEYALDESNLAKSQISMADGPHKDTSNLQVGFHGRGLGQIDDKTCVQFTCRPAAVVFNAGLCPNNNIARNLENIFPARSRGHGLR
eukprot:scaffold590647_cov126-Attheya_sp.AAC.2